MSNPASNPPLPLGVSASTWTRLGATRNGAGWHIPERNVAGDVVGTAIRHDDGRKSFVPGGRRGLTMLSPALMNGAGDDASEPLLLVEGPTDAAIGNGLGFFTIGRPSATGGVSMLKDLCARKHVVICGENDENGVGQDGARNLANELLEVAASVKIIFPPAGAKDLRDWCLAPAGLTREEIDRLITRTDPITVKLPRALGTQAPVVPWTYGGQLIRAYPKLRPACIDGLLRTGETMNCIATSKARKTWLMHSLALTVTAGQKWLGTFDVIAGRVLYLDNELHPETTAHRLPMIASALGLADAQWHDRVALWHMRGNVTTIPGLRRYFSQLCKPGDFDLVILDAYYRLIPPEISENDNAAVSGLYSTIDSYADMLQAAFAVVHHTSKGGQADKRVTDVGAGAGAQSRAADTHLVLREHEDDGVVVVDVATRSWPPVRPFCVRWNMPVWLPAPDADPRKLRGGRRNKQVDDEHEDALKTEPWTEERFVTSFVTPQPQIKTIIVTMATQQGLSRRAATDLLALAEHHELIHRWIYKHEGDNRAWYATIPQPMSPTGPPTDAEASGCRGRLSRAQPPTPPVQVRDTPARGSATRAKVRARKRRPDRRRNRDRRRHETPRRSK